MKNIKALKEFAKAVGCTLKAENQADGSTDLVLYDANKEPLVTEFDSNDMVDSLTAYKGGHPNFKQALEDYKMYNSDREFRKAFTPNKHGEYQ